MAARGCQVSVTCPPCPGDTGPFLAERLPTPCPASPCPHPTSWSVPNPPPPCVPGPCPQRTAEHRAPRSVFRDGLRGLSQESWLKLASSAAGRDGAVPTGGLGCMGSRRTVTRAPALLRNSRLVATMTRSPEQGDSAPLALARTLHGPPSSCLAPRGPRQLLELPWSQLPFGQREGEKGIHPLFTSAPGSCTRHAPRILLVRTWA